MAPNRSQVSRFPVQLDLESSNDTGKAIFPPLTGTQEVQANQHHEGKKDEDVELFWEVSEAAAAMTGPDNYWVEESRHHHNQCERNIEKESSDKQMDARDLYWDWPSEEEDKKATIIATILKEEFARTQVSGDKITENLVKAAKTQAKSAEEGKAENDDYWQWEAESSTPEYHGTGNVDHDSYWDWKSMSKTEQQSQLIESIVREEAIRIMFSADHITKNLIQQAAAYASSQQAPVRSKANTEESDEYWTYPAKEGTGYWDFPGGRQTSVVPVGTNRRVSTNSYWAY